MWSELKAITSRLSMIVGIILMIIGLVVGLISGNFETVIAFGFTAGMILLIGAALIVVAIWIDPETATAVLTDMVEVVGDVVGTVGGAIVRGLGLNSGFMWLVLGAAAALFLVNRRSGDRVVLATARPQEA